MQRQTLERDDLRAGSVISDIASQYNGILSVVVYLVPLPVISMSMQGIATGCGKNVPPDNVPLPGFDRNPGVEMR